jgi:hypothetical protein
MGAMYGPKIYLILMGFIIVASISIAAAFALWRERGRGRSIALRSALGVLVALLAVALISPGYIRKGLFHYELWKLRPADVYSIQIGHHNFRDRQTINDIVGALQRNRWFEVNHGGWGDSVPLTLRRHSGTAMRIDVALYFQEPGAIIGPANRQGLDYSVTQEFAPDLPRALEKHGVKLPDCDTAHKKPCTAEQLNP